MDISTRVAKTRDIEILDPATETLLGVRVTLLPMDDPKVKQVEREMTDRRLRLQQRGKTLKASEVEADYHKLLWAAVDGWEWYNPTGSKGDDGFDADASPSFEGEVPEFTQANFMKVIKAIPWFGNQINEELGDTKSFFTG